MFIVNKHSLLTFFLVIFFVANLVQFGIYRGFLFEVSAFFALLFFMMAAFPRMPRLPSGVYLFWVFSLLVFISAALHFVLGGSIRGLLAYLFFLFSLILVLWYSDKLSCSDCNRLLFLFLIFSLSLILYSFINYFSLRRFSGVFDNPNGMGRFAGWTMLLCVTYIFFQPVSYRPKNLNFLVYLALFLSFVSLILSNSRLPLLSIVVSLSAIFSLLGLKVLLKGRFILSFALKVSSMVALFFLVSSALWFFGFFDELVNKFVETFARGDFTQDRANRWSQAIPYFTWFGHGHDIYNRVDFGEVHSNYISQILIFGWIPAVSMYLLLFYLFFLSLSGFWRSVNFFYIFSFAFFVFYFVYSLFETGFAILPIYLAVFFLGLGKAHESKGILLR